MRVCFFFANINVCIIGNGCYGWALLGVPTIVSHDLKKSKRWSILLAYIIDGYIVWKIYQGSIIVAIFNDFVKNQVLLLCSRDQGPCSVLVLDNCKTH